VHRIARQIAFVGLCALLSGCANAGRRPSAAATQPSHDQGAALAGYWLPARPAAALVFASPMTEDAPPLDLSRDDRQPSAFVGYPEGVVEFFSVHWMDRQAGGSGGGWGGSSGSGWGSGYGDRYERCAVSAKVGVLNR
jgi:hypothetical protein